MNPLTGATGTINYTARHTGNQRWQVAGSRWHGGGLAPVDGQAHDLATDIPLRPEGGAGSTALARPPA